MDIELPLDIQNELRALEARGDAISHYALLGIPADADGGAIRRAYLECSKRFHPDAHYRKDLGEFADLLGRAFQRIAAAYQILSDDEARAEYDREHVALFSAKDQAAVQRREATRLDEDRRRRERRERLLHSKGFARVGAARKLYEEALEHAAGGQRGLAIHALRIARELDPHRTEIAVKTPRSSAMRPGRGPARRCWSAGSARATRDLRRRSRATPTPFSSMRPAPTPRPARPAARSRSRTSSSRQPGLRARSSVRRASTACASCSPGPSPASGRSRAPRPSCSWCCDKSRTTRRRRTSSGPSSPAMEPLWNR